MITLIKKHKGGHVSNGIYEYLEGEELIGFDKVFGFQRVTDGYIAARLGITSLAPIGFIIGLLVGYALFN